jgi:putative sterol carrier protein
MTDPGPADVFAAIHAALTASPVAASRLDGAYLFDLHGEGGGLFHIVATDGQRSAGPGTIDEPNAIILMAAADFVELSRGRLNATLAFMDGRLRIRGDYSAALRLQDVLGAYDG